MVIGKGGPVARPFALFYFYQHFANNRVPAQDFNLATTNTADKEAALKLLLYMSEPEAVLGICQLTGLAPARLDLLATTETGEPEFQRVISHALETGRSLPNIVFSALLEDKLHYAFGEIWADVLNSPQADPRKIIIRQLGPLKEQVGRMING